MTRLRWLLALPALLIATSGSPMAAEIKDKAGLFTAEALRKASIDLDRVEKDYKVPVTIETIDSLDGKVIDDLLPQHARAANARGLYVLIARAEHKIEVESYKTYAKSLTRSRCLAIRDAFMGEFKQGNFDAGLTKGIDKIDSVVAEAKAESGGVLKPSAAPAGRRAGQAPVAAKPSSGGLSMLLTIGLGLLALFIVIRVLGAIFSGGNRGYAGQNRMMGPGGGGGMGGGPGYGPGYGGGGGGGGGFMSSMFGGIGGALAGNWLYDQFSGRHHDSSVGQSSNYDATTGAAAPEETGPDYVGPGDGGGDWGGGAGGAGGDWGGGGADAGGGGDWGGGGGGGGGGGDWGGGGGGGGGDWGGGGGGGGDGGDGGGGW